MNMWCAQTLMLTKADADRGRDHHRISENRFAGKYRNDFRHEGKARNDQDVDFRMSEYPEEVHPEHGRATGLGIEEMAAQIAIDEQHDLRRRQRRNRDQNHSGHHQVQPRQQRHAAELHPGHRRHRMVAMMLIAVPMLPKPETSSASVQ